ncbi:MAG: hypothetical protein ACRDZ0_13735 [Acidimicrobiales bacterium]
MSRPARTLAGLAAVALGRGLASVFDRRDDGVQHNLHVRDTASGGVMTEITERPVTQSLEVTFDRPGEFAYRSTASSASKAGVSTNASSWRRDGTVNYLMPISSIPL